MSQPEFDQFSGNYEELLKDPIRDRFASGGSEFFHQRKRDLIRQYFTERSVNTHDLRYLDVGCGKGELASSLHGDFAYTAGCDPSAGMLQFAENIETRVQEQPGVLPFESGSFDFVTAVCVYHHVPPAQRLNLCNEVRRVLRPGGIFAVIEHNPYNPLTRLIVSRTPVDADAILLKLCETRALLRDSGFLFDRSRYFLYFPEQIYRHGGSRVENWLGALPLGGQYAAFGVKQ
jgi:SAM-dependent methyltransferase